MSEAMRKLSVLAVIAAAAISVGVLQAQQPPAGGPGAAPAGGGRGGGRGPVLSVTSSAWPDGGEVPMKYARNGENKSPAFDFQWFMGMTPASPPATLQSYAVVFHDISNAGRGSTTDTLHWTLFNIPGTAKGLAEGLPGGDLPDGSRNGPGLNGRGVPPGAYFGPGAPVGPFHHYIFEFYALDAKLDLAATATRDELMKAMEGHVVGKAAYAGRFRPPAP